MDIKKYERNKGKTFQRYVTIFLGGPFVLFLIVVFALNFLRIYKESGFFSSITTFVLLLCSILSFIVPILCLIETWYVASMIEISDNEVIGYSQHGNNKWIMKLDDITEIYKSNGFNHIGVISAMVLKSKDGEHLFISMDIQKFGECMEYIASKVVNAKKINFGSWQNDRFVWTK